MKRKKIFTVTDLGGGDGGKGGVVHKICCEMDAHTVLKVGGAQGSHGVRTSKGNAFNFSQFGCGTFEGVRTHVTDLMVIEPLGLMHEAECLRFTHGITDAFDLITVDENCLCATPYHGIASRLAELSRKERQKGTIGLGIGEAQKDSEIHPELAIRAKDLGRPDLAELIEAVRQQKIQELRPITDSIGDLWESDREFAIAEKQKLEDESLRDRIVAEFRRMKESVRIVPREFLQKLLSLDQVYVVESSHGILTDKYHGFHPYTSRLRTVPSRVHGMLQSLGYDGELVKLGVTRAYQIRHGAGPLVTESRDLAEVLLPGSHKDTNRWQGSVRVGPLDFVALRYAIEVCGEKDAFDGIALSWFDQIELVGKWSVCNGYLGADDPLFFSPSGEILVRRGEDDAQLSHQARLAWKLFGCHPRIESYEVRKGKGCQEYSTQLCSYEFQEKLGVPVRMISFGPTECDKVCL